MKVACPTCRKKVEYENNAFRPFCSERCRTRDLGAWASEEYRVPAEEASLSQEELLMGQDAEKNGV